MITNLPPLKPNKNNENPEVQGELMFLIEQRIVAGPRGMGVRDQVQYFCFIIKDSSFKGCIIITMPLLLLLFKNFPAISNSLGMLCTGLIVRSSQ